MRQRQRRLVHPACGFAGLEHEGAGVLEHERLEQHRGGAGGEGERRDGRGTAASRAGVLRGRAGEEAEGPEEEEEAVREEDMFVCLVGWMPVLKGEER